MVPSTEQRKAVRISFHAPTVLQWRSDERTGSGTVSNMSQMGCYVLTQNPALVGERLFVRLNGELPEIEGLVRYVDQQVGMGVQFVGLKCETEQRLSEFLRAKAVLWA